MGMEPSDFADARTTPGVGDQRATAVRRYLLDDISFRLPNEWIVHVESMTDQVGQNTTKSHQSLRVGRSGSPSTNNLSDRRQIETHNAVFEEVEFGLMPKHRAVAAPSAANKNDRVR